MFLITFFAENHAGEEIMWKNTVEPKRQQVTIVWRMRFACRITKATHKHTDMLYLLLFHATVVLRTRLIVMLLVVLVQISVAISTILIYYGFSPSLLENSRLALYIRPPSYLHIISDSSPSSGHTTLCILELPKALFYINHKTKESCVMNDRFH